jgi:predicted PP-loop superfamily ATPase
MPAAKARSATAFPTILAAAIFPPPLSPARVPLSSELADTSVIVDDLRINVTQGTVNTKARAAGRAHHALPHAVMDLLPMRVARDFEN